MTLVHLDRAAVSGVGATSGTTPLVAVGLFAHTSESEHLVLDTEAGEGLTGLYVFNLVHISSMRDGSEKVNRLNVYTFGQLSAGRKA